MTVTPGFRRINPTVHVDYKDFEPGDVIVTGKYVKLQPWGDHVFRVTDDESITDFHLPNTGKLGDLISIGNVVPGSQTVCRITYKGMFEHKNGFSYDFDLEIKDA